eukprot:2820491-Amphidinium_carterae.1
MGNHFYFWGVVSHVTLFWLEPSSNVVQCWIVPAHVLSHAASTLHCCYPVVSPRGSVVIVFASVVLIVMIEAVVQLSYSFVCCAGLVPVSLDASVVGRSRRCPAF